MSGGVGKTSRSKNNQGNVTMDFVQKVKVNLFIAVHDGQVFFSLIKVAAFENRKYYHTLLFWPLDKASHLLFSCRLFVKFQGTSRHHGS